MSISTSKVIDQKEYLKKYLSGDKEKKKKHKHKKHKKTAKVKIIDDDAHNTDNGDVDEDLIFGGEDAPQIVGEYIEENPSEVRSKWRNIAVKEEEDAEERKPETIVRIKEEPRDDDEGNSWGRKASTLKDNTPETVIKIKQERRSPSSDQSPPRRRQNDDYSPARRNRDEDRKPFSRRQSDDQSPPRQKRDRDLSPQRGQKNDDIPSHRKAPNNSDQSPPRRRRDYNKSPPRRRRSRSDQSPPRRRNDSDRSSFRGRRGSSQFSPPINPKNTQRQINRRSSDQSPPRKRRDSDQSPKRRRRRSSDHSPPRRDRKQTPERLIKKEHKRSPSPNQPFRKSRWGKRSPSPSPPPTHKSKSARTLDGKKAGLQDAESLKAETDERRRREHQVFEQMSSELSGRDADIQIRSTGRRGRRAREAANEDPAVQQRKEEHERKKKELYDRWGRGLKQLEDHKSRQEEMAHEASKPVARYANDEDLDRHLREQEHADDPMLEYMRAKRKKQDKEAGKPVLPKYEGSYPENRFGIPPGYRWDGVDRSNGYEKRWFNKQNERRAVQDEAYKYSVEDM